MYKEQISDTAYPMLYKSRNVTGWSNWAPVAPSSQPNNLRTAGEATPHFHARLKRGELLPFTRFRQVENKLIQNTVDVVVQKIDLSSGRTYGGYYNLNSGDVISWTEGTAAASGKINRDSLMQRVAGKVSGDWDVLTFAAEFAQTVNMFRGLLTKVANLIRTKPPDRTWNSWLEYRYGWRTLAFDMQDIEKAFSARHSSRYNRQRSGQSLTWEVLNVPHFVDGWMTSDIRISTVYEYSARGTIVLKGEAPRFSVNVLKTAWEVTKLSFVVDWFINIGAWIDSVSFVALNRDYESGYGELLKATRTVTGTSVPAAGCEILRNDLFCQSQGIATTRGPASIPLIPLPHLNLDSLKVADLIALLIQALVRK